MDPARGPIAGRYKLEQVIGRGGMSTVYRATDSVLGRTVAVKVMLAGLADEDPAYIARFEREARAAAAFRHPAVVAVYDVGVDGDVRFIVMEHVAGRSLATLLRGGKPLAVDQAVQIGEQVAGALAAAHAVGIVHRDVKPANVMVADDGAIKVLDFGVARMLDGTTITQAASVLGTAAYMAPERAEGRPGDARSDIYSLGCLLYAMLTGGPPFRAEHAAAVLHQHVSARPRPPRKLRTGVPAALDSLVGGMLAKAPEARPQSAGEVRDRLAAAIDPTAPTVPLTRTSRSTNRRALAGALATAALALLVLLLASSGGGSPQRAPSAGRHAIPASTRSTSATQTLRAAPKPAVTVPAPRAPASKAPAGKDKRPPGHGNGHGGKHHDHGHGGGGGA